MSNENKEPQKQQPANPLRAEAQLYQRIEAARAQIAGAVNKTMQDTGLPTAIILELLRGIVAETQLMLERAGRVEVEREAAEARETIDKAAKEAEAAGKAAKEEKAAAGKAAKEDKQ